MNKRLVYLVAALLVIGITGTAMAADKVVFWSVGYTAELQQWLTEVAFPKFTAETGLEVEYLNLDWGERDEKVRVAALGGVGPDVIGTAGDLGRDWGHEGLMIPLNKYLDSWDDYDMIIPSLFNPDIETGTIYGIPLWIDLRGVLYNKSVFREIGLDDNSPPQSWEEFLEVNRKAVRITADALTRVGYDDYWPGPAFIYAMFLYGNGGRFYSEDFRQILFDGPESIETLEFLAEVFRINNPTHVDLSFYNEGWYGTRFVNGTAAMVHGGTWMAQEAMAAGILDDMGLFVPRRSPETEPAALSFVNGIGISSLSSNPDRAWQFIEWLMSADIVEQFHAVGGTISTRADSLSAAMQYQPELLPWYEAAQYARMWETIPSHIAGYVDENDYAITWDIINGSSPAQSTMSELAAVWQSQFDAAWSAYEGRR